LPRFSRRDQADAMEVGPSSCSTEPDAPREDKLGARWVNVEQAQLAGVGVQRSNVNPDQGHG
jgi:hypothetical protein